MREMPTKRQPTVCQQHRVRNVVEPAQLPQQPLLEGAARLLGVRVELENGLDRRLRTGDAVSAQQSRAQQGGTGRKGRYSRPHGAPTTKPPAIACAAETICMNMQEERAGAACVPPAASGAL
jgi:hypothetical protein